MSTSESPHEEVPNISPSVGGESSPLEGGQNMSLSSRKGSKRTNEDMEMEEEVKEISWRKRPKVKAGRRIKLTTIIKAKPLVKPAKKNVI